MTALWYLWPQHLLFYILTAAIVAGSRVVVGAHYLGDTLAGALIAMLTTRYVARILARGGIDLAAARHGLVSRVRRCADKVRLLPLSTEKSVISS